MCERNPPIGRELWPQGFVTYSVSHRDILLVQQRRGEAILPFIILRLSTPTDPSCSSNQMKAVKWLTFVLFVHVLSDLIEFRFTGRDCVWNYNISYLLWWKLQTSIVLCPMNRCEKWYEEMVEKEKEYSLGHSSSSFAWWSRWFTNVAICRKWESCELLSQRTGEKE